MKTLEEARIEIDQIDRQLAVLFEERMKLVRDVALYKVANQMAVFDAKREQQVIEKNCQLIQQEEYKPYFATFLQAFMDVSKQYQKTIVELPVIGYQGTEGAFSHLAATRLFPDHTTNTYATFEDVFKAVASGEIRYGVIPFENSYTGEVGEVLDLLKQYQVYITDMYDLKVDQHLLGIKGAEVSQLKQVYSHHQAISQCKTFLKGHAFELIPYPNTALAAKYIAQQQDPTKAAIASKETAALYGLDVLVEEINTSTDNTTRFIVLSKQLKTQGNQFSLLFTVKHDAGQLAKVMQVIASKGYNMQSIRSRSLHKEPWKYYFYVAMDGSLQDSKTQELLAEIGTHCEEYKVIGSYQK